MHSLQDGFSSRVKSESNMAEDTKGDDSAESTKNLVDMLLGKNQNQALDHDTMILETQKRVWGALKRGYEYSGVSDDSDEFLRRNVLSKMNMAVLYVDLVGSTTMTLEMPEDKIAIIISSFSQEMATVIRQHHGYVLKFVGDAVIGYFIGTNAASFAADNAVKCARSMIPVIAKGINPILMQYDYPDLMVKIGVDFGENIVVRYGADAKNSHVDLMGPAMNIASKIQSMAKPNQILIGSDVYSLIHPDLQRQFSPTQWSRDEWKYRSRLTGEIYKVFEFRE